MNARFAWTMGCILAAAAVAAGAFGAHALRDRLPSSLLAIYETAARYQMYHALALLLISLVVERWEGRGAALAGWAFIVGIVIFSGSLYLLSITGITWLGAITPIGGVAFLLGWGALAWAGLRRRQPV